MTSNIGVRDLKDFGAGIGFSTKSKESSMDDLMKSTIQNALKKTFSPEFLNRLDDVIIFNSLYKEHIHQIIDISLDTLFERILGLGYKVELTRKAKDFLADKGYDPQYGARPLNRAIQKYLEDQVAEEILKGDVKEGDIIVADHKDKDEQLTVYTKKAKKKEESKKTENPEDKKGNTETEQKQEKN
jgi:ATP-dependent Clp protease ATP-binding subunit ClpC